MVHAWGVPLAVLASTAWLAAAPPSSGDAYAIYDRAREVWSHERYPDPLAYRITVRVDEGAKREEQHYRAETIAGGVRVNGVSDAEQQAPHEAKGVNFRVTYTLGWEVHSGGGSETRTIDADRKESSPDYLGVPLLSPEYSFGLNPAREVAPAPSPGAAAGTQPRTIATVITIDRSYDVTLAGTEMLGGIAAYHLRLRPRFDPERFRLRDLWVDRSTYAVLEATVAGNFTNSPGKDVPWSVTFRNAGGATYIDTERALAPLVYKHDRTFTHAAIVFDEIGPPPNLPLLPVIDRSDLLEEPGY